MQTTKPECPDDFADTVRAAWIDVATTGRHRRRCYYMLVSMADDLWKRYDEKVVQLQHLQERYNAVLRDLEEVRADRDRWIENSAGLKSKLASVRALAEKLRSTGTSKLATEAVELTREAEVAREVIGLILIALAEAWSEEHLAWRASTQGGVNLLASIASGQLAVLPGADNQVPREWLADLDIHALRRELAVDDLDDDDDDEELELPPATHRIPSTDVKQRARTDTFVGKPQFPRPTSASISGMTGEIEEFDVDTSDVETQPTTPPKPKPDGLPTRKKTPSNNDATSPLPPPPPVSLSRTSPPPPLISND